MRKNMMEHIVGGRALVIGSEGHLITCEASKTFKLSKLTCLN